MFGEGRAIWAGLDLRLRLGTGILVSLNLVCSSLFDKMSSGLNASDPREMAVCAGAMFSGIM